MVSQAARRPSCRRIRDRCRPRPLEVPPDQAGEHPASDAPHLVLTLLLPEHGVPRRLAGQEQPAVLHLAVELAEHPVLWPRHVGDADDDAHLVAHLELELGLGEPLGPAQVPRPGLPHGLGTGTHQPDWHLQVLGLRPAVHASVHRGKLLGSRQVQVDRAVEDDQGALDAHQRGRLDGGARGRCEQPVTELPDVVGHPGTGVVDHVPAHPARDRRPAGGRAHGREAPSRGACRGGPRPSCARARPGARG